MFTAVGPGSVNRDRLDYAEAMARSWKEQLLLNIVKLRYGDTPMFLEVSSVISSYQMQSQVSVGGLVSSDLTPGLPDTVGRSISLGGSGVYTDKPTITYAPLQGEKFTRSLLRPISPAALMQLVQAGYPIDVIFQLGIRAINGLYNRSNRPMGTRDADPEFYQLLDTLRRVQQSEAIAFRLEKGDPEETTILMLHNRKISPAVEQDIRSLRETLGLQQGIKELSLVFGAIPRSDKEVALLTRSSLEIYLELGARVQAPAVDVKAGRVSDVPPPHSEGGPRDQPLVHIYSGESPPERPFVAVRYGEHWFWIEGNDFRSKSIFSFLLLLSSLAETGVPQQAPIITVPVN